MVHAHLILFVIGLFWRTHTVKTNRMRVLLLCLPTPSRKGPTCPGKSVKRLFLSTGEIRPANINPYLMPAPNVWVSKSSKPISKSLPGMMYGSKPADGGHLHLTGDEREVMISAYPQSEKFIRRLIGSQEMLKDIERYCLWIENEQLEEAVSILPIAKRIESVRQMRLSAPKTGDAYKLRNAPHRFRPGPQDAARAHEFDEKRSIDNILSIAIPSVSSAERKFLPVVMCNYGEVINNSAFMIPNAEPWHMAILSSTLHRC